MRKHRSMLEDIDETIAFLESRLISESGKDAKETKDQIEELKKERKRLIENLNHPLRG